MAKKIITADDEAAPKFRDAQGRVWHPRVTCHTCTEFEKAIGASFFDPATLERILKRACMNEMLTMAYLACIDEVEERKVSQRDFQESIANLDFYMGLSTAVTKAAELFSPSLALLSKGAATESAAPGTGATSTN